MVVELARQFFVRAVQNKMVAMYDTRRLSEAGRRQISLTAVPTTCSAKSVLYTARTAQISDSVKGTRTITSRPATPKTHSKRTISIAAHEIEEKEITMRNHIEPSY